MQKSCTYLNNLKVTEKILELFRSRIEKKGVLVVSIFDLVLDGVYAVCSFLAQNMLGK